MFGIQQQERSPLSITPGRYIDAAKHSNKLLMLDISLLIGVVRHGDVPPIRPDGLRDLN